MAPKTATRQLSPSSPRRARTASTRKQTNQVEAAGKPNTSQGGPTKVVKKTTSSATSTAIKRQNKKWLAPFVYESDKSPLARSPQADIRAILGSKKAWDCLSPEDRREVLSLCPDRAAILHVDSAEAARPDMGALLNSNDFRNDCSRYLEDLRDGRHDPAFVEEAWQAHWERRAGSFHEYRAQVFRNTWGVDPPAPLAAAVAVEEGEG